MIRNFKYLLKFIFKCFLCYKKALYLALLIPIIHILMSNDTSIELFKGSISHLLTMVAGCSPQIFLQYNELIRKKSENQLTADTYSQCMAKHKGLMYW